MAPHRRTQRGRGLLDLAAKAREGWNGLTPEQRSAAAYGVTSEMSGNLGPNPNNPMELLKGIPPELLQQIRQGRTSMGGRKTRRNRTSGGDIVTHLLTIRNQIKLYHWQTREFARHTATDALTLTLDTNIDAFVESYMGRYGRPKVSGSIKLHNFSESAARAFVAKETKYLETELPRKIGKNDTDLLNLRDTILGDLTKVLYLFTLR
jgi:hypothetical protein